MRTTRVLGLAGLVLAGGILNGCCWDKGNCTGGSKTTLPPATQVPPATTGAPQQPTAWSDPPRTQIQQQAAGGRQQAEMPAGGVVPIETTRPNVGGMDAGTGVRGPSTSGILPVGGNQVDPGMGGSPVGVRDANSARVTPPPVSQRDSWPQSGTITAPQPPNNSLPPPPPTLPPVTPAPTSSSNYPSAPPMPPLPGQSKIPVLPQGGPSPVE